MTIRLVDLHDVCLNLISVATPQRLAELGGKLPCVGVTALGGFPFKKVPEIEGAYSWAGHKFIHKEQLAEHIMEALGVSGVLTYTNPRNRTLKEIGAYCHAHDHSWALHWVSLSLVFANHPRGVELAFARDTRFRMSWTVDSTEGKVFVATAGIKEWLDYTKHKDDKDFDRSTRFAMQAASDVIWEILNG